MPVASRIRNATRATPATDGRQRRSERSREAIVQALFELVGGGILQPTAQQVAETAGVGIRSVFRHFADMESLFAEMGARLQSEALPLLRGDVPEGSVEQRARSLADRRIAFFEKIAPSTLGNHPALAFEFLRGSAGAGCELRENLLRGSELERAPADLVEALDLATSFEAWDRLRSDQRLARERAQEALERIVLALSARRRQRRAMGRKPGSTSIPPQRIPRRWRNHDGDDDRTHL
jgi:AcrR family transcriptional regulator